MRKYKSIFKEMPHIDYGDKVFDLEMEKFKDVESFLKYLESIILGDSHVDKYGNRISLKTRSEKSQFISSLQDDSMFTNFVKHKLNSNEQRFLNLLLKSY